jgi:hypothetical protein
MNQGFFGFSGVINDLTNIKAQEFDISDNFVIPSFAKRLYVLLIGGGGSGGSGGRYASGSTNVGGGGGGGGRIFVDDFPINIFGSSGTVINVVIGAGGVSVNGATVNTTAGTAGNAGGASSISINGTPGTMILAGGGNVGGAGNNGLGGQGSTGGQSWCFGDVTGVAGGGGNGSATNFPQGPGSTQLPSGSAGLWNLQSNGGCGGGGLNSSDVAASGGAITAGGAFTAQYSPRYTSGNNLRQPGQPNTGTAGDSSFGYTIAGQYSPGLGGVGGGGGQTTNAGPGRDGYRGGGGGGGGAALNGFNGGASGAGGNGYCVLIAYG